MNFIEYDSISDKMFWFNQDTYLSFTVKLTRKDKDGNRNHYHSEYIYDSQYIDTQYGISIKRQYDYYLSINSTNSWDKLFIQIRIQNMIMLNMVLKQITNILLNNELWVEKNGRLMTKGTISPLVVTGLPMNKWLQFEATPIINPDGKYSKGVRITLSDNNRFVDINMDQFLGFTYLMGSIDMLQLAATLINYIPNSEIYNTNRMNIDSYHIDNKNPVGNESIEAPKRTISKQQNSFFDM